MASPSDLTAGPIASGLRDRWLLAIVALALLLRLYGATEPLIDQQAWRQTDTAAIARNFHEEGYSILQPRVDWRGDTPGFVETNFPLFPWLVAALYGLAGGAHDALGRLLAAVCSTASVGLLYLLVARLHEKPVARVAAALYAILPLSWFFGRAFMPEALMMALSLATLLSFADWLDRGGGRRFVLAAAVAALCFMVKIPTLYLGFPLLALAWHRHGAALFARPALWGYAAAVLLPAVGWYAHAAQLYGETGLTFGIWGREGYDKWDSSLLASAPFYTTMARRFATAVVTPPGLVLGGIGLVALWRERRSRPAALLAAWLAALALYVLLVPEGNRKLHYYQLPFAPAVAWLAGWGLVAATARLPVRLAPLATGAGIAVVALFAVPVVRDYHRPPNNVFEYYQSCLAAGAVLDERLPPRALVVVGDLDENEAAPHRAQNPSLLYYMHRKGWQITPAEFSVDRLIELRARGATHFVAATRFVMQAPDFWRALLDAGVSTPGRFPDAVTTARGHLQRARAEQGLDRHFIVVDLSRLPPQAGTAPAPGLLRGPDETR